MNIVILGRPGAGKGTQSKLIEQRFGLSHLSTGDLLRSAKDQDTPLARKISARIDRGNFVSDELIMSLVEAEIRQGQQVGYIFDGIPRNVSQAKLLAHLLGELSCQVDVAIELCVDDKTVRQRLLDRAKLEHRKDDNDETITHRLAVYQVETAPLIQHFQEAGVLSQIDGDGTPERVFAAIEKVVSQLESDDD